MEPEILNLGAVAIIFIFFLKEFFAYLKTKKNGNGNYKLELEQINNKLGNHLTEVNGKIADIERTMTDQSTDIKIIKNSLEDIKITISK